MTTTHRALKCILPGCRHPVGRTGPCRECRVSFGGLMGWHDDDGVFHQGWNPDAPQEYLDELQRRCDQRDAHVKILYEERTSMARRRRART